MANAMVISLGTPDIDWEVLARVVERTGAPLWLEVDGTIQGVLLPADAARRLMGHYTQVTPHAAEGVGDPQPQHR